MKQKYVIIRRETPTDYAAVEHLTREAFWNVYRPGCLEHYVVHVLRRDPAFVPELDLVTVIASNSVEDSYAPRPYFSDYVLSAYTG